MDILDTAEAREQLETYVRSVLLPRFEQEAVYIRYIHQVEAQVVRVTSRCP